VNNSSLSYHHQHAFTVADSEDDQNPLELEDFKNREVVLDRFNHLGRVREKTTAVPTCFGVDSVDGPNARETPAEAGEEETSMTRMSILHISIILASVWVCLQA
jgi:hypothetical protein